MATFEWDANKRLKTLEQRGLDFADAEKLFEDDCALSLVDLRHDCDERWQLLPQLIR